MAHDRWVLNIQLAEARWAQQQARERELEEVKDFLQWIQSFYVSFFIPLSNFDVFLLAFVSTVFLVANKMNKHNNVIRASLQFINGLIT